MNIPASKIPTPIIKKLVVKPLNIMRNWIDFLTNPLGFNIKYIEGKNGKRKIPVMINETLKISGLGALVSDPPLSKEIDTRVPNSERNCSIKE